MMYGVHIIVESASILQFTARIQYIPPIGSEGAAGVTEHFPSVIHGEERLQLGSLLLPICHTAVVPVSSL